MIPLALDDVARLCAGDLRARDDARELTGVQIDSRRIAPGDLFVAVGGGTAFLGDSFARGAAATLVPDDAFAALAALGRAVRERSDARFVGITGSSGKTSTKDILLALCRNRARTIANERSYNAELGVPLTICRVERDTEVCILELAMRGLGQIAELCEIARPDVGVVTNVGPAHLELVGSLENVARAKRELVDALPPQGVAVVPVDFECRADVDVRRVDPRALLAFEPRDTGSRGVFDVGGRVVELELSFTARHQALNALTGLHTYDALGLPLDSLTRLDVEFSAWRGEETPLPGDGLLINDCYNANPASMHAALVHLAERAGGRRLVAVLGDMAELGSAGPSYHAEIGRAAAELGVAAILAVGDLARGYLEGGVVDVRWAASAAEAVAAAEALVEPGDAVLVKGSRAVGLELVAEALAMVTV